ncbi:MAG: hypothetical protein SGPRY_005395, partial [Prymnesium sp.]
FRQYDPIVTHAVEDDSQALEARLRTSDSWIGCLTYDRCEGLPPLHLSALCCSLRAARVLLEGGASVNYRDSTGHTPLAHVIRAGVQRTADHEELLAVEREGAGGEEEGRGGGSDEGQGERENECSDEGTRAAGGSGREGGGREEREGSSDARLRREALAEIDSSLDRLWHLAADLVGLGASATAVRHAPASEELLEWVNGRPRWKNLLDSTNPNPNPSPNPNTNHNPNPIDGEGSEGCNVTPLSYSDVSKLSPRVVSQLAREALRGVSGNQERRWQVVSPLREGGGWWGEMCEVGMKLLSESKRKELRSERAPPDGSRLLFWEVGFHGFSHEQR